MRWETLISRTPTDFGAVSSFVEVTASDRGHLTFSTFLDARQCERIDREAYVTARGWYRESRDDPTVVAGVSLGRAIELPATVLLVRFLRARAVVAAIAGNEPIALAGVGREWELAARELGRPVVRLTEEEGPSSFAVPDPALVNPNRYLRLAAGWASGSPMNRRVAFLGSPDWALPYLHTVRWSQLEVINPGRRFLLRALAARQRPAFSWLSDNGSYRSSWGNPSIGPEVLRGALRNLSPRLAALAGAPRNAQRRVLIATQDVSPGARVAVLATRAAGGRVITLEHGIAGTYREQVHSVADVLGAWGEPQRRYHELAGAPGQRVISIGWPRLASTRLPAGEGPTVDILYFGQPVPSLSAGNWPEDMANAARLIGGYAERHAGRRVAWKPHPASDAYGGAFDPGSAVPRRVGDSLRLISESRVVAAASSTTALEAMAIGRPVIQLRTRGTTGGPDFIAASGAAQVAGTDAEFEDAAEQLLNDQRARRRAIEAGHAYVESFIVGFRDPGHAERQLVEVINDLAGSLG